MTTEHPAPLRRLAVLGLLVGPLLLTGCATTADADFVEGRTDAWGFGEALPAPVALRMPHVGVSISSIAFTDAFDASAAERFGADGGMRAAEGAEFVQVRLTPEVTPFGGQEHDAVVEIRSGDDVAADITQLVDDAPKPDPVRREAPLDQVNVVVSVARDAPVTLAITDEGETGEVDLRTGELTEATLTGRTAAFAPAWSAPLSGQLRSEGTLGATASVFAHAAPPTDVWAQLDVSTAYARAQGWLPEAGWAPERSSYLTFEGVGMSQFAQAGICQADWDLQDAVTFTPTGGEAVHPAEHTLQGVVAAQAYVAFEVPSDITSGTLRLAPGNATTGACGFSRPMSAATLEVELE